MIYIGIDVAKDKHDCFITNSEGEVLFNAFTIPNNADGFHDLFQKISSLTNDFSNVKVGLEATGHYNYNLLGFLIDKGLPTFVINPLHTNLFRKSLSLRQTKTDKVDAHTIALMMMSGVNLQSYSHMEKRGSRYLRYALFNATKFVCIWDNQFSAYLAKKRSEGKHYNVAISHAAKKLVRLIFAMEKSGKAYLPTA